MVVIAHHNASVWQTIHTSTGVLGAGQGAHAVVMHPWNFIKAQARSASAGMPATMSAYITMRR